jgi:hypothetical protein
MLLYLLNSSVTPCIYTYIHYRFRLYFGCAERNIYIETYYIENSYATYCIIAIYSFAYLNTSTRISGFMGSGYKLATNAYVWYICAKYVTQKLYCKYNIIFSVAYYINRRNTCKFYEKRILNALRKYLIKLLKYHKTQCLTSTL